MKFIKDNGFLLAVLGVLIAGGAAGMIWRQGQVAAANERMGEAQNVSGQLASAQQRDKFNADGVGRAHLATQMVLAQLENVAAWHRRKSRGDYAVLAFQTVSGTQMPAFPLPAGGYDRRDFSYRFSRQYYDAAKALLDIVQPTAPPTLEDLNQAVKAATPAASAPTDPTLLGRDVVGPGMLPQGAIDKIREDLTVAAAKRNRVYATEKSLFMPVDPKTPAPDLSDADLWLYQMALWVQRDILTAIRGANDDAAQAAGVSRAVGVPASAIKRLVGMTFRGYVVGRPAPAMPMGGLGGLGPVGGGSSGPAGLTYIAPRLAAGAGGTVMPSVMLDRSLPMLTQRGTDPLRDVVHYDFTVIVRPRDLQRLLKALQTVNFHTVLDVEIRAVEAPGQTPGAMAMGTATEDFYYGSDGVVQATIVGELQLASGWTRGVREATAPSREPAAAAPPAAPAGPTWSQEFPPLMPPDMLGRIRAIDPTALRPEDQERAPALPAYGDPGMGGPGAPSYN